MFICCALFLYLWYVTDSTVGRDDLTLVFFQLVPPAMAGASHVHVLGVDH